MFGKVLMRCLPACSTLILTVTSLFASATENTPLFQDMIAVGKPIFTENSGFIVSYQFPGSVFTPTMTAPGSSASDVNNVGSSSLIEAGLAFPNSIFLYPQVPGSTTAAGAVANQEYFQFSVTPNAGRQLDLHSLVFDAARGGSQEPRGWVLRSSIDGYAASLSTAEIPTLQPTLTSFSVDLGAPAFQHLADTTTFRLYAYVQAIGAGQGLFFNNMTLAGSVTPEPSTLALLGLGAGTSLVGVWRHGSRRQLA
jgi:hypothetical protein